jgi:NADH-quinone oxidoreductase subunit A
MAPQVDSAAIGYAKERGCHLCGSRSCLCHVLRLARALHLAVRCGKGRRVRFAARIRRFCRQITRSPHPDAPRTGEGGIVAKGRGDGHVDGVAGVRLLEGLPMSQAMNQLLLAYLPLIIFVGVAAAIALALLVSAFLLAYKQPDPEKLSAYECGFNAFDDARMKFDVRFYLVAILFIIFDLEVTFLFPWAATFGRVGALGFWAMMIFLAVLTIGFTYEWKKGALEWD